MARISSCVDRGTQLEKNMRERLAKVSDWWSTPLAERRECNSDLSIEPVFFRIDITSMSGLRGLSEAGPA
jgi:hypothetical protein